MNTVIREYPGDPGSLLISIYRSLQDALPLSQDCWPQGEWPLGGRFEPPRFEVVVGAILTQSTNWHNVETALSGLVRASLVSAEQIDDCPVEELQKAIRPAGFYIQKTGRLKKVARFILDHPTDFYGSVERQELLSISGIGPETADCILLYACDQPHFVVDRYTCRILSRYGLLDDRPGYQEVQHLFESNLPVDVTLYKRFHALLVEHAKRTCRKKPLCQSCVFQPECAYPLDPTREKRGQSTFSEE